ncbi:phage tail family protein [bacterium]|jgi:hypothetical protein|nr:phage tail family protein [bacterium]
MSDVTYYLDGVDIKTYGVYVKSSDGLLSRPKPKKRLSADWPDYNGELVDLSKKVYESRSIKLECFIKATSKADFQSKMVTFLSALDAAGTRRLMVVVDPTKPLVYEVYLSGDVDPVKKWSDTTMVGTFKLEFTEPSPIKRVVAVTGTSLTITISSPKLVDIYWGDGSVTNDVSGTNQATSHTYSVSGTYYAIVAGNIDEITAFSTTGTVLWTKL